MYYMNSSVIHAFPCARNFALIAWWSTRTLNGNAVGYKQTPTNKHRVFPMLNLTAWHSCTSFAGKYKDREQSSAAFNMKYNENWPDIDHMSWSRVLQSNTHFVSTWNLLKVELNNYNNDINIIINNNNNNNDPENKPHNCMRTTMMIFVP